MSRQKSPLPDAVRRFVLTSIPSVPYLEAALLLRDRPEARLSVSDVARGLYLQERAVAGLLDALVAAGVVQRDAAADGARYRYAPRDAALQEALDGLAAAYASDLVGITTLIHDATQKSAQRFADAFRIRKDP